ncbi:acetate--CoA ligase family protein [Bailinhaonella thermotolerans]|uniref:CoA-binding protein n=1 Tax=Bailinhaonella thermotolerans TaxID=1070861 RepID=A0A3A4ABJ0_9ACTN|nr:acetate--CoA ligase family protein [Bailinhaonella thermotolerans]RJL26636.1 CoA-binding protein [Bailinhaonella thermotolerans]
MGTHVPEPEVKAWLSARGVPVPRGATAPDPASVAAAAEGLTPPLVLKAYGEGLIHKSDAGAVVLELPGPEDAARAAEAMAARLAGHGVTPSGYLVEEQAGPGVEVIIGVIRDPAFGPVLLTGLGGVWTEAMADTAVRLCPVTREDAKAMLGSLRGSALLRGHRGRPAADVDALLDLMVAVSRLDLDHAAEFELNPVICGPGGVVAVDARLIPRERDASATAGPAPGAGSAGDFRALFEPKAVAVAGASARKPNFGNMFIEFYKATGIPLVAVHPEAAEIGGVPAVPSIESADVDYALVAVPAERCADVVRRAAGTPYVQVMSGGFRETGRADLEEELLAAAREAGVRLLGPNCMGVYCPKGGQTFIGGTPGPPGDVALISQSGGLAGEVIKVGEARGLAFSRVATLGNSADVTPAELLRWLGGDDETAVIGLYLEDPRDGRALFETLRAIAKPVVLLVGGRSRQGARAAASHTGGMVSDDRVWRALAEQTGVALVTGQDDLIGALDFHRRHARRDVAGDSGVLVIGPSGGASVLAADVFDAAGLTLTPLPADSREDLRALGLGAGSSLANPLEIPVGPRGRPELVRDAITAITSREPYPDVVAHVNVQSFFTYGSRAEPLYDYVRRLGETQEALPRTRITLVMRNAECGTPDVEGEVRRIAGGAGVPVYRSMEAAAVAVAAGQRWHRRESR